MRNLLHPFSKAQYIIPGSKSFLTQYKLGIPVDPSSAKPRPRTGREEFEILFNRVCLTGTMLMIGEEEVTGEGDSRTEEECSGEGVSEYKAIPREY